MSRLAAVLAAAIRDADHGSWGEAGGHWSLYPPAADRVVAAIPERERDALSVGLLLADIHERLPGVWLDLRWSLRHSYWQASSVSTEGDSTEGIGPTPHAALTALLERLVAS